MSILDSPTAALTILTEDPFFDEAQVAAAAYLAGCSGRTLDAYRYDLRCFFQWASDAHLAVLEAKRPHIEFYRPRWSRGTSLLRPSTGDCPRSVASTASPTSTGGFRPILPNTSADRRSIPPRAEASIAKSSEPCSTPPSDSTRTTLLSPCYSDSTASGERLWDEHRGLRPRPWAPDP